MKSGKKEDLEEDVTSIRALDNIISEWKGDNYQFELDYYIYNFIKSVSNDYDRAYLYFLFKSQGGFFGSKGWDQNPDYGKKGAVTNFEVSRPRNKSNENIQILGQKETVDIVFGKGPERTV